MLAFHTKNPPRSYETLDECIDHSQEDDMFLIGNLIRGQPIKKQKRRHLKPTAMVRFNLGKGKDKPTTILALLDSGGSESLLTERLTS